MTSRRRIFRSAKVLVFCSVAACYVTAEPPRKGSPSSVTMIRRSQSGLVLLAREDVRKDLELVESQERSVSELVRRLPKRLIELMAGFTDLSEVEQRARINQFRDRQQQDIERILLPHQVDRLRQITFQFRINVQDVGNALTGDEVVDALEITDRQLERLKSIKPDVQISYRQHLLRVREEAVDRMLAELTAAQRAKWKELVGSLFSEDASSDEHAIDKILR